MIRVVSTNIISPSGLTTEENYISAKNGESALKTMRDWNGIPGQICGAVFSEKQRAGLKMDGFTWFESLVIRSIEEACAHTEICLSSERTGLIISTTKGNIDCLGAVPEQDDNYTAPGAAARKIASYLGIVTDPLVVCNACISGVTAQILAWRLMKAGKYDKVIVCGADTVSPFCVSGFLSFKSMSPYPCLPFSIERRGLNLGEGAATIILSSSSQMEDSPWSIVRGTLTNDAYHISAPSPEGEGVKRAIEGTLRNDEERNDLATVCAHGTATMFNDQMESKAIQAAGLSDVPLSAYKPFFGHTLGAAGVIESVLAMRATDDGVILPVLGFDESGVSGKINACNHVRATGKGSLMKIISGFGGCNGAILFSKHSTDSESLSALSCHAVRHIHLTQDSLETDGQTEIFSTSGASMLTTLYKQRLSENARFYKMDLFSRLVYVASGLLIQDMLEGVSPEAVSMILFNRSSSLLADRRHLTTFRDQSGFYPSPVTFVNTLPNVVIGDIAAKYGLKGETTFIILDEKNEDLMDTVIKASLPTVPDSLLLTGWVECAKDYIFEADLKLLRTE